MLMTALLLLLVLLALAVLGVGWGACRGGGLITLPGPWALPLVGGLPHMLWGSLPSWFPPLTPLRVPLDVLVLNNVESLHQALTQKWSDFAGRP
uniref:Uncharacterized protein n=1 Tax=Gopherus agassizii TaxID=38772 RepID=A0A452GPV0_9SAUR